MKYFLFTFLVFIFTSIMFPQTEVRGSMGIDFISSPSLSDYINQKYAPPYDQLKSFTSAVVFSVEGDMFIKENYQVGLELSYLLNSFTYNSDLGLGSYDLTYKIIMPAIVNYYVIQGTGYEFKFGGGIGIPFVIVDEKIWGTVSSNKYNSTGLGIILRADGNTVLSGNVYANIGADLKYGFNGKPKNGNQYIVNEASNENVNFNSFSVGIHLGITYRL
jgi:hypothetical protein